MSSGGGKGGSTTSSVKIPDWIKEPAQRNLARAEQAAQVGYMPWYGPDVAAATPQQLSAMQASNTAAQAFGLAPKGQAFDSGLPQAQTFAGGVQGYSSAPLFNQAVAELAANNPSQYNQYQSLYNGQYLNQNPSTSGKYQVTSPTSSGSDAGFAPSDTGAWGWDSPGAAGVGTTTPTGLLGKLADTYMIGTGTIMNTLGINQQNPSNATVSDLSPTSYNLGNVGASLTPADANVAYSADNYSGYSGGYDGSPVGGGYSDGSNGSYW